MTLLGNGTFCAALALAYFTSPVICQTFRVVEAAQFISSNAIARADFNHDGFPDLASANNTGTVSVLLSDSDVDLDRPFRLSF